MIKINSKEIDYTLFPNLEMLVDTKCFSNALLRETFCIDYQFSGNESLLHLYFILSHIKDCLNGNVDLTITYMPYSRMDRSQNGSCFTLAHIVRLITSVLTETDHVSVIEPHSAETEKQFNLCGFDFNYRSVSIIPQLASEVMKRHAIDVVCYPDKGARERYDTAAFDKPIVYCEKKRDFDTGNIIGLDLITEEDLQGKTVLIVDDLCSKGGTFYHTANKLREAGAVAVYLAVCHMEQNVVNGELVKDSSPINHVYCTNTMFGAEELHQEKISVFNWINLLYVPSVSK